MYEKGLSMRFKIGHLLGIKPSQAPPSQATLHETEAQLAYNLIDEQPFAIVSVSPEVAELMGAFDDPALTLQDVLASPVATNSAVDVGQD